CPPRPRLFPYTTLFRSGLDDVGADVEVGEGLLRVGGAGALLDGGGGRHGLIGVRDRFRHRSTLWSWMCTAMVALGASSPRGTAVYPSPPSLEPGAGLTGSVGVARSSSGGPSPGETSCSGGTVPSGVSAPSGTSSSVSSCGIWERWIETETRPSPPIVMSSEATGRPLPRSQSSLRAVRSSGSSP